MGLTGSPHDIFMATTPTKKAAPKTAKTAPKAQAKSPIKSAVKTVAKAVVKAVKTAVDKSVQTPAKTSVKVAAAKKPAAKAPAKTPAKAPAKTPAKAPAKTPAKVAAKTPAKKPAAKAPVKTSAPASTSTAKPVATAPAKAPAVTPQTNKVTVKPAPAKAVPNAANFKPYVPKKGEIYMSKEQLAHFADILTRLMSELMADIERTVHTMQDEQTVFADPNDRASQETDMALELRNRDRERKLIKKIEETLARIKADDYGFCDKCGIEIGIQRLEARPTATLCIDCKTLEELREKQVAK